MWNSTELDRATIIDNLQDYKLSIHLLINNILLVH